LNIPQILYLTGNFFISLPIISSTSEKNFRELSKNRKIAIKHKIRQEIKKNEFQHECLQL